jgi:hypothetical protein
MPERMAERPGLVGSGVLGSVRKREPNALASGDRAKPLFQQKPRIGGAAGVGSGAKPQRNLKSDALLKWANQQALPKGATHLSLAIARQLSRLGRWME